MNRQDYSDESLNMKDFLEKLKRINANNTNEFMEFRKRLKKQVEDSEEVTIP